MNKLLETPELVDPPEIVTESNGHDLPMPPKPLNIWRPSQFLQWTEPPGYHLLLPAYLTKGEMTTFIGQAGLGKTRLALRLAICQILARPWCGLQTGGEPAKWLFLSDENSILRLKQDLQHIFKSLTAEEIARVDDLLRLPAMVEADDCEVWLGDVTTQARIAATIESERPGAIVADPLGNFAPGDISKPGDMNNALRVLLGTFRHSAPEAAILVLHHARTGRQNIVQGVGYDAANFSLGGKALLAKARCQINFMPGRADDSSRLVMSCAKANNCPHFTTRGLIFDPLHHSYAVDPDFDLEAWKCDVEGRSSKSQSLCSVVDVVEAVRDGYNAAKALVGHLETVGCCSNRTAQRLVFKATELGGIMRVSRGKYMLGRKAETFLTPTACK